MINVVVIAIFYFNTTYMAFRRKQKSTDLLASWLCILHSYLELKGQVHDMISILVLSFSIKLNTKTFTLTSTSNYHFFFHSPFRRIT
jgi:hypothetical protein